jgi:hypothetical protein
MTAPALRSATSAHDLPAPEPTPGGAVTEPVRNRSTIRNAAR